MVRKDSIDLGLWKSIQASELYIPLDVHLFRASQYLGFTSRKSADFRAMIEVTEALKKMDPKDPIRFDFALCRIGILKENGEELLRN
jgi:uncharacterized protein (TIGR02757 family)